MGAMERLSPLVWRKVRINISRALFTIAVHHLDATYQLTNYQLVGVPSDTVLADVQRHECGVPFLRNRRRISYGRARRPVEPPQAAASVMRFRFVYRLLGCSFMLLCVAPSFLLRQWRPTVMWDKRSSH